MDECSLIRCDFRKQANSLVYPRSVATFNKKKYSSYNFQTAVHAIFILPLFEITISSFSKVQSS